jgi:hypothetical protein
MPRYIGTVRSWRNEHKNYNWHAGAIYDTSVQIAHTGDPTADYQFVGFTRNDREFEIAAKVLVAELSKRNRESAA